jgi:hypothetical protein
MAEGSFAVAATVGGGLGSDARAGAAPTPRARKSAAVVQVASFMRFSPCRAKVSTWVDETVYRNSARADDDSRLRFTAAICLVACDHDRPTHRSHDRQRDDQRSRAGFAEAKSAGGAILMLDFSFLGVVVINISLF